MTRGQPLGNVYNKYGTRNPIERKLVTDFLHCLRRLLIPLRPNRVLDLGCGEGVITRLLREMFTQSQIVAVDVDLELLRSGAAKGGGQAVVNALPQLCFSKGAFDLVVLSEVLEHVERPREVLATIREISAQNFLVSVPNEPIWRICNMIRFKYVSDFGNTPGHINHFSAQSLTQMLSPLFANVNLVKPFPWLMASCAKKPLMNR